MRAFWILFFLSLFIISSTMHQTVLKAMYELREKIYNLVLPFYQNTPLLCCLVTIRYVSLLSCPPALYKRGCVWEGFISIGRSTDNFICWKICRLISLE